MEFNSGTAACANPAARATRLIAVSNPAIVVVVTIAIIIGVIVAGPA